MSEEGEYYIRRTKEVAEEQERLYEEYKKKCGWEKKTPELGKLNPYQFKFSEKLKNSVPEEEFKKLCAAWDKENHQGVIKLLRIFCIIFLVVILTWGIFFGGFKHH